MGCHRFMVFLKVVSSWGFKNTEIIGVFMVRIAVLDDDVTHAQSVQMALCGGDDDWAQGVQCEVFFDVPSLLMSLRRLQPFDCLILDRQVGARRGDEVMHWLRESGDQRTMVLMVTGETGSAHAANLLSAGADDYVTKPFDGAELLARVRRLLARQENQKVGVDSGVQLNFFEIQGYRFNRKDLSVCLPQGETVVCTEREFSLAAFLLSHVGQALSRRDIAEGVWQRRVVDGSRAVDSLVYRVRSKIGLEPSNGWQLRAIYGFGYRLDTLSAE